MEESERMTKITTIVFDLDGTLLNTLDDLADSTNYALAQFGFPTRSVEEAVSYTHLTLPTTSRV